MPIDCPCLCCYSLRILYIVYNNAFGNCSLAVWHNIGRYLVAIVPTIKEHYVAYHMWVVSCHSRYSRVEISFNLLDLNIVILSTRYMDSFMLTLLILTSLLAKSS